MNVLESFRLHEKVAVVTGGAGLYGRQIVEALAEAGARTFMASRTLEKLQAQAEIFRQAGLNVTVLQYDQASEPSVLQLLRQVIDAAGKVDILVNNSVSRPMSDWSSPAADFAKSMEVNATGLFLMIRASVNTWPNVDKEALSILVRFKGVLVPITRFTTAWVGASTRTTFFIRVDCCN